MTFVMGVLNVTPDSFSDGGRYLDAARAIEHGLAMSAAGAHSIDVGGESTRPGADRVSAIEEQARVIPVVTALAEAGVTVSIDTMSAATAAAAVVAGARIVNDVSGGLADPAMADTVAGLDADIVLMHWRAHSATMNDFATYGDVVAEVRGELADRVRAFEAAGVAASRIVIDPGLGFAKNADHNWALLGALDEFVASGYRVLVGASRKRFLRETVPGVHDEATADSATAAVSALSAVAGAWAVRVHNVAASRIAIEVAMRTAGGAS